MIARGSDSSRINSLRCSHFFFFRYSSAQDVCKHVMFARAVLVNAVRIVAEFSCETALNRIRERNPVGGGFSEIDVRFVK